MERVLVICGPTASGKTALAVELARIYGGEVISADSMQIYTDMDIASAKASADEQKGIPHHLLGFLDPAESFSVADYVRLCGEKTSDIISRGKLPIICGGTGLYISSFVDNIYFEEGEADYDLREKMREFAAENGNRALWERLFAVDPETALTLHENNTGRVIRALEVYETSGHTISEAKKNSRKNPSPYDFIMLTLDYADRETLRRRINERVDKMLEAGLLDEAREIFSQKNRPTAAQAIGIKELFPYLRGEKSLEECVETLKARTRQYAKRQMTWFRRDERIIHILVENEDSFQQIVEKCRRVIDPKLSV